MTTLNKRPTASTGALYGSPASDRAPVSANARLARSRARCGLRAEVTLSWRSIVAALAADFVPDAPAFAAGGNTVGPVGSRRRPSRRSTSSLENGSER